LLSAEGIRQNRPHIYKTAATTASLGMPRVILGNKKEEVLVRFRRETIRIIEEVKKETGIHLVLVGIDQPKGAGEREEKCHDCHHGHFRWKVIFFGRCYGSDDDTFSARA